MPQTLCFTTARKGHNHFMQPEDVSVTNEILGYAISPQQRRLLSLDQERAVFPYVARVGLTIEGGIDRQRLENALAKVIAQHEISRTQFVPEPEGAGFLQVILPDAECDFIESNSSIGDGLKGPPETSELDVPKLDPLKGKVVHCNLEQKSSFETILTITMPSVCADAPSLRIFARDLVAAYQNGATSGDSSQLVQYADAAQHLNDLVESEAASLGREYWLPRMSGAKRLDIGSNLETSRDKRPFVPAVVRAAISRKTLEQSKLPEAPDTSPEIFLFACWQALLTRLSSAGEPVIGYAIDGRQLEQLQNCMGPFEKYLPIKPNLQPGWSVAKSLAELRLIVHDATDWQGAFQWPTREEYCAACFSYYAFPVFPQSDGAKVECSLLEVCSDRFDCKLNCSESESSFVVSLWYDSVLFSEGEARQLLSQYCCLVGAAAEDPHRPMLELNVTSEEERHRLLCQYNDAPSGAASKPITAQIEEVAAITPEAVALQIGSQQLTYGELNRRANQLAHFLRKSGAGPDQRIAVCMSRTFEVVIAMFGVLKTGAAYIPLDPEYPDDRLAYMVKDSQALLVLSHDEMRARVSKWGMATVFLDSEWGTIAEFSESDPEDWSLGANLCYLIYTSGSSGTPKGVAITRQGLQNYVEWAAASYGCTPGSQVPLYSSLSFDLTVTSLWVPLAHGSRIILASPTQNIEFLLSGSAQGDSQLVKLTPAHLRVLKGLMGDEPTEITKQFIVGGEALRWEDLHYWRRQGIHIVNEYGPTETVVGSCAYWVIDNWQEEGRVPIGRPIANTTAYVLDKKGRLCPAGACGELYLGGMGVARGYWNQPALTAERFLPDEFSGSAGGRLYRTGDLVRWRAEGQLEYLGRLDGQVKIHGYRIELEEIESVLRAHEGIEQAAVVVREDTPGEKRLVAYVVSRDGYDKPQQDHLKQSLRSRLPEIMVPAVLMWLKELPLTANGKLDRNALPQPKKLARANPVPPSTATERILSDIWMELLKLDQIGVHDNFFELGGDSILGIQAISRARKHGLHFTPRQMYKAQTIAELALLVSTGAPTDERLGHSLGSEAPLSPIQARFFEWQLDDPHHYNQSVLLELASGVDSDALEHALLESVARHAALRTRYHHTSKGWRQSIDDAAPGGLYERKSLRYADGDGQDTELERHANEVQASLDFTAGRLVRAVEYDLGAERGKRLLIVIHHLAVDGVSWRILLECIEALYEQISRGHPNSVADSATSYKSWVERLRAYSSYEDLIQELEYWCSEERKAVKPLPVDFKGTENGDRFESEETVSTVLSDSETQALLKDVPSAYHTHIDEVLLCALGRACAEWTNDSTFLVDVEGHGREDVFDGVDVSGTIGWFTNIYPFLLEVGSKNDWEPGRALAQTKTQMRAVPKRGLGYGILLYLNPDPKVRRRLESMPCAQVSFNYLGQLDQTFSASTIFRPSNESSGRSVCGKNRRAYLIDVQVITIGQKLHIGWSYSRELYGRATIEGIAESCARYLRRLIAHCQSGNVSDYEASDFPLAKLSTEDFVEVSSQLKDEHS